MEHLDRSFKVSLHVLHATMNPAEVTQALGLFPWKQSLAGPPRKPPFDRAWWAYQFDCSEIRELAPFLDEISSRLEPHRDFLLSLLKSGGSLELFCGISVDFNWDEILPASLMGRLSSLGIDLRLDAYPKKANPA
jgi:hypothetical protein